ncbi:protein-L-isoaspartate O-methyltransferase [Devosia sp. FKR38]|uniref:protein-L-isoaspartate O-methyltransferase family protein n=1 Tax=Devosia sp. FKR38 TaxID=2562312 RepID=UPI0010C02096|nr:protein-L-isoaspartate O-methyltransferase [Devosia sp. FKR38]
MTDFGRLRAVMVDNQLRTSGVTERGVLAQMGAVPRERFVPVERQGLAYIDDIHWLGGGRERFMMAPATLAKLLQLAEITETDSVLDVGAGTGYATAVIAGLAATVVGLEADAALAQAAKDNLAGLGLANASVISGDLDAIGTRMFDLVFVQGTLDIVPNALLGAVKDGGRLVALVRDGGVSVASVFVKTGSTVTARGEFNATLPALDTRPRAVEFVF